MRQFCAGYRASPALGCGWRLFSLRGTQRQVPPFRRWEPGTARATVQRVDKGGKHGVAAAAPGRGEKRSGAPAGGRSDSVAPACAGAERPHVSSKADTVREPAEGGQIRRWKRVAGADELAKRSPERKRAQPGLCTGKLSRRAEFLRAGFAGCAAFTSRTASAGRRSDPGTPSRQGGHGVKAATGGRTRSGAATAAERSAPRSPGRGGRNGRAEGERIGAAGWAQAPRREPRPPLGSGSSEPPGERPDAERRGPGCPRQGHRGRSGYYRSWVNPARVGALRQFCAGYRASPALGCGWLSASLRGGWRGGQGCPAGQPQKRCPTGRAPPNAGVSQPPRSEPAGRAERLHQGNGL